MTDPQFYNELWIASYIAQIDGYPLGHPSRTNFKPIVAYKVNDDGSYNRPGTLESYTFSADDKALLLKRD